MNAQDGTSEFPANRDEYAQRHGSERLVTLARRKWCGRMQRRMPFARLRRMFARWMGVKLERGVNERSAWIGGDVYLDDSFPELVAIGSGAVLGVRCMVLCHDDAKRLVAPVRIGKGAYIGAGAILLPGVVIGDGAIVGAGAVATRSIPAGEAWAGVPARKIETKPPLPM